MQAQQPFKLGAQRAESGTNCALTLHTAKCLCRHLILARYSGIHCSSPQVSRKIVGAHVICVLTAGWCSPYSPHSAAPASCRKFAGCAPLLQSSAATFSRRRQAVVLTFSSTNSHDGQVRMPGMHYAITHLFGGLRPAKVCCCLTCKVLARLQGSTAPSIASSACNQQTRVWSYGTEACVCTHLYAQS